MKLLLDTHVWLWQGSQPQRLGPQTRALLEDRRNDLFLSIASIWELTVKHAAGKLQLPTELQTYVRTRLKKSEATVLGLELDHIFALRALAIHHRDPFDRLLVCQVQVEAMTLLTADERLSAYPVPPLNARC